MKVTNKRRLATQAIEDALRLVGTCEEVWANGGALSPEARSASTLIHLAKEKMGTALAQLGGNEPTKSNEELLQEYLATFRAMKAEGTLEAEQHHIRKYIYFLEHPNEGDTARDAFGRNGDGKIEDLRADLGSKSVAEVDFKDIRRFFNSLAERNLREGSIHISICAVRAFHKFLTKYYGYDDPGMDDIIARDYRGRVPNAFKRRPISREDIRKLIQAAKGIRDKTIIGVGYYTGLRVSELANLRLSHVNVEKGLVWVERGKGGEEGWAKYSKEDLGMIVDRWLKERGSYLNARDDDHFFVSTCGKGLSPQRIREIVHEAAKRAGIQAKVGEMADGKPIYRVSPHVLRHCFATHASQDGMKFEHIQRQMRHKKPSTTMIYIEEPQEDLFESYVRFRGVSTKRRPRTSSKNNTEGGEEA